MKLSKIYELAVKYGIQQDPRGKDISEYFKNIKKEYRKLKGIERITFDKEALTNPFSDTRLLCGNPDSEIKKILVGIDIETAEILLADRIREREGLDLALSHHPEGIAYAGLSEVMRVQGYILNKLGLHKEAVSDSLKERVQEVARKILPANHSRPVDAARLLNMPFMSCHTPADNFVAKYLQENINKGAPKALKDILNFLHKIPEYKEAAFNKAGPR
ncbi:MAG TPA: NGG1p interacting factor NIF3, partial [Candidatus Omnitrophica bacterium]|nr:NGG1p interacting factor NIF3 [Candidatus Omnitrophota bacterium]